MEKVLGLKCRECGEQYPKSPVHVCEFCFGPLEVEYNYEDSNFKAYEDKDVNALIAEKLNLTSRRIRQIRQAINQNSSHIKQLVH